MSTRSCLQVFSTFLLIAHYTHFLNRFALSVYIYHRCPLCIVYMHNMYIMNQVTLCVFHVGLCMVILACVCNTLSTVAIIIYIYICLIGLHMHNALSTLVEFSWIYTQCHTHTIYIYIETKCVYMFFNKWNACGIYTYIIYISCEHML